MSTNHRKEGFSLVFFRFDDFFKPLVPTLPTVLLRKKKKRLWIKQSLEQRQWSVFVMDMTVMVCSISTFICTRGFCKISEIGNYGKVTAVNIMMTMKLGINEWNLEKIYKVGENELHHLFRRRNDFNVLLNKSLIVYYWDNFGLQ